MSSFEYTPKLKQLETFTKQQKDTGMAGQSSRGRTKKMIGLGQAYARETEIGMEDSARGVRKVFDQVNIGSSRGKDSNVDFQMASWIQAIEEGKPENKVDEDYDPFKLREDLYGKKGGQDGEPVKQSYFNTEIIEGGIRGNSRKSGDASIEVQQTVVNKIIEVGGKMGMTDYEIAYTLAIARAESGFNPDAASTDSSAAGVGQFIDDTGSNYGITNENRWDVDVQVQALVDHTLDNFQTVKKKGYGNEYVYALHHDGIGLGGKGLSLSKKNVMPFVPKYLKDIQKYRGDS